MAEESQTIENQEKSPEEKERKATQLRRFKWLFIIIDVLLFAYAIVELVLLCTA